VFSEFFLNNVPLLPWSFGRFFFFFFCSSPFPQQIDKWEEEKKEKNRRRKKKKREEEEEEERRRKKKKREEEEEERRKKEEGEKRKEKGERKVGEKSLLISTYESDDEQDKAPGSDSRERRLGDQGRSLKAGFGFAGWARDVVRRRPQ